MSDALRDLGRILYSPNAAILRIRSSPRPYVALSVAVFVLSSVFSADVAPKAMPFVSTAVVAAHIFSGDTVNLGGRQGVDFGVEDMLTWAESRFAITSAYVMISNIVWVAAVYLVGGRLGTKSSFERIFCTMSYAVMPLLVGGLITAGSFFMFLFLLEHELLAAGGIVMVLIIHLSFTTWSLIITVKAIKRTNDVGTIRAIWVVAAAIGASTAAGLLIPGLVAEALLIP